MATTATFDRKQIPTALSGGYKKTRVTIDWDTYVTGGFDLDPSTNKLGTIVAIVLAGIEGAITWTFVGDLANSKVVGIVRATGAQVANGADLSTVDTIVDVYHY